MSVEEFLALSELDRAVYWYQLSRDERIAHERLMQAENRSIFGQPINRNGNDAEDGDGLTLGGDNATGGQNGDLYRNVSRSAIDRIFRELFGRPAEDAGAEYYANWVNEDPDANLPTLYGTIYAGASDEDKQWYVDNVVNGGNDNGTSYDRMSDAEINAIYQELFGRDAAQGGLDYWGDYSETLEDNSIMRDAIYSGASEEDIQWYIDNVLNDPDDDNNGGGNNGGGNNGGGNDFNWEDPYNGVGPDDTNEQPGMSGGYNWNWEAFQSGAPSMDGGGGYDPNEYAFDRYVPGQESPWGVPDVEGGNKDFYRNQMVSLLSDEQNFRGGQRRAEQQRWLTDLIRSGAEKPEQISQERWDNEQGRLTPTPLDWSWLEGGLPEVQVGGPDDYRYNEGYEGLSNIEALTRLRSEGDISRTTYDWFRRNWEDDQAGDQTWWTGNNDYNEMVTIGVNPTSRGHYQSVADGLYTNYGAPNGVAPGYAAPIQGFDPRPPTSNPTAYYNPFTGTWDAGGGNRNVGGGNNGGVGNNENLD